MKTKLSYIGLIVFLVLISVAGWVVAIRLRTTVVFTTKSPSGHVLLITFRQRGLNPMGEVVGEILKEGRVVSRVLMVDDETNPIPPRVVVRKVEWVSDSVVGGRCIIHTVSKEMSQQFVIAYMKMIPGEFAHFPTEVYSSEPKTK